MGSSPVAVSYTSNFAPASSKECLDIQATIECGFTLEHARDITRTCSHTPGGDSFYFVGIQSQSLTPLLHCNTCRMEHLNHENLSQCLLSMFPAYRSCIYLLLFLSLLSVSQIAGTQPHSRYCITHFKTSKTLNDIAYAEFL